MKVLHVAGSPRTRSRSRRLAESFLDALGADDVTTLDVWTTHLPDLGGDTVEGRYRLIHGDPVGPDMAKRWGEIRRVAEHAMAHYLWLISTPTWNFALPYRLKQWIDCIVHPGMTFTNDSSGAVTGLAAGKTAVLVGAGALDFAGLAQETALDFQMRYLDTILRFIGIDDVHIVRAAPTFGPDEMVQRAEAQAVTALAAVAGRIRDGAGAPS
jgi:FMN-dependent NADH-azoreductase